MSGKKILSIAVVCILLSTVICTSVYCVQSVNKESIPVELNIEFIGYDSYGNYVIDIDTKEFYGCGYENGDYVIISWHDFSTRAIVVPDYSGLFVFEYFIRTSPEGEVCVARQCGSCNLEIGDMVNIKYYGESHRNELMPNYVSGECDRAEWMTDEDYVNFRCVQTAGMKADMLYRSYDAFAKINNDRAAVMDTMFDKYDIGQIIDMKADRKTIENNISSGKVIAENASWYLDNDQIFAEEMSVKFLEDPDTKYIFQYIADNDGPYLVHCSLGKDRTGFIIMVLEALMGATYEEMRDDYCYSYICLYDIDKGSYEYETVEMMCDVMMIAFNDPDLLKLDIDLYSIEVDVRTFDFKTIAEKYLTETLGMSWDTVDKIRSNLAQTD